MQTTLSSRLEAPTLKSPLQRALFWMEMASPGGMVWVAMVALPSKSL